MTGPFKLLCQSCGLSMREAAAFLDVKDATAKCWWLGTRTPKQSVLEQLHDLFRQIDRAADEALAVIQDVVNRQGAPEKIELGLSSDDYEAQGLGFPCAGAHEAVIRRVMEKLPAMLAQRVIVVPRGSTASSARAADAHEKITTPGKTE